MPDQIPDLAHDMLSAVRLVAHHHQLNPAKADDAIRLVTAVGEVMMAIARFADNAVDGVVVSRKDGLGTLVTVHSGGEYMDVNPPTEEDTLND
jgi:hypothetical protein